jgi:hypothetical protein
MYVHVLQEGSFTKPSYFVSLFDKEWNLLSKEAYLTKEEAQERKAIILQNLQEYLVRSIVKHY